MLNTKGLFYFSFCILHAVVLNNRKYNRRLCFYCVIIFVTEKAVVGRGFANGSSLKLIETRYFLRVE